MTEQKAIKLGGIFQITMMATYIAQFHLYEWTVYWTSPWLWPSHAGAALFLYCLYVLYIQKRGRPGRLIVEGPFRYTRHPMYTGLALMDMTFWVPQPASTEPLFFALQAVFFTCLIVAAWFQEKETIARFGHEAKEYYTRTPRLILLYPFAH